MNSQRRRVYLCRKMRLICCHKTCPAPLPLSPSGEKTTHTHTTPYCISTQPLNERPHKSLKPVIMLFVRSSFTAFYFALMHISFCPALLVCDVPRAALSLSLARRLSAFMNTHTYICMCTIRCVASRQKRMDAAKSVIFYPPTGT
jgi:hypothetical protein